LSLERSDLAAIETQINAQADLVVQSHGRAILQLQVLWSDVLQARRENAEEMIRTTFDVSKIQFPVEWLMGACRSVIEVEEIQSILFIYRGRDEQALTTYDARLLRERSTSLIGWGRELQASVNQDLLVTA
jgi:hypothetical protein